MSENTQHLYDERNKANINNFNEGITNHEIRNPMMKYHYGPYQEETPHGYEISLACQSGTDIMHVIGNVSAIALQYIVDQFPSNTFATAMPSTKLAHRQLRHTPKQIRTQPYPMCIVSPRVSLSGLDNRLAAGSFATTTWSSTSNRFQNRSEMEKLFFDKRKGIEWRGKINRVVMYFDFVLAFRSIAEQIRWASYFINKVPTDGGFFDIDTALELALPDGFLAETARYAGIPMKGPDGDVSHFVDYLNMNSALPISYRFSSGRHRDAFYAYYVTTILSNIVDFSYSNVTKINQVESDCPITFTMRCEFNTIGFFDLSVPNPGPVRIMPASESSVIIPIFSDTFNEKDFPLLYGWKIHARPICKMDWGETEISISEALGKTLNMMIDYHLEHNLNPELFISVKLRDNRCLINDGYYVDWKRRMLVFTNVNYTHTYRLIIVVNKLYINDYIRTVYGKN